jgi:hypothetical protein
MFCNKCGDPVGPNERFCNKCGNPLNPNPVNNSNINAISTKSNDKKWISIGIGVGLVIFLVLFLGIRFTQGANSDYYFDDEAIVTNGVVVPGTQYKKGKYTTAIIYDNQYTGVTINSDADAYALIASDSIQQKKQCPNEIRKIENNIINNYGVTAVNLCEMDLEFAQEIENVFAKVYAEYPKARGVLTNLTLVNMSSDEGTIAAFMPIFVFAKSDTSSYFPLVIKTQLLLNASYFLNIKKMEMSVKSGSKSGHFPKNATRYSPVAHELGHYLSFLALMDYHRQKSMLVIDETNYYSTLEQAYDDFASGEYSLLMITEAYNNYKRDTNTTLAFDDWRGTISQYALAKDNAGKYIYDETIAESFHDVYLNGDNAADASKYIVAVLKSKLGS